MKMIFLPILVPFVAGLVNLFLYKCKYVKEALTLAVTGFALYLAWNFFGTTESVTLPWAGFGMEFDLRLYHFSSFILLAAAFFAFAITVYSVVFMKGRHYLNHFYAYILITLSFVSGAVLADNLVLLLFFWEGLLLTLYGFIAIGRRGAVKTATKAFVIVGISDLCMMIGIALAGSLAGTLTMSKINLPVDFLGSIAFILMMIGALAKAGAMPFHTWIPDAAGDAPLPFMAFLPASLEKLVGIYLLARISLNLFVLTPDSWLSMLMMIIGSFTIIFAVMMALIQKEYKKLLSFHAISQVGYMVLGIGTCLPIGIIGGLFHMINHALYKSCLFLTGGSVEKQAGTTELASLGGLGRKMPITFICFIIAAASISGVPPFNGFFSKELVYDAAMERHWIFYVAAILGTFFTAASFLKLGHAAFLGKRSEQNSKVKESSFIMLLPMIVIAGICVLFGLDHYLPLTKLIQPIIGATGTYPMNTFLVVVTVIVLIGAVVHHLYSVRLAGSAAKASDHIRYAHVLKPLYDRGEKRKFDLYEIGKRFVHIFALVAFKIDRAIDWIYDGFTVRVSSAFSNGIRAAHTGKLATYVVWAVAGAALIIYFLVR